MYEEYQHPGQGNRRKCAKLSQITSVQYLGQRLIVESPRERLFSTKNPTTQKFRAVF